MKQYEVNFERELTSTIDDNKDDYPVDEEILDCGEPNFQMPLRVPQPLGQEIDKFALELS